MYHLRLNKNPAPRLHYCFLATPPWTLYPLPSWISNCSNLCFEAQEGHRGWSLFPIRNWGTHNSFYTQEPHRVLVSFKAKHWLHLSPSGSCSAHLLRCVWISLLSCVPSRSHVPASLLAYCPYLYDPSFSSNSWICQLSPEPSTSLFLHLLPLGLPTSSAFLLLQEKDLQILASGWTLSWPLVSSRCLLECLQNWSLSSPKLGWLPDSFPRNQWDLTKTRERPSLGNG